MKNFCERGKIKRVCAFPRVKKKNLTGGFKDPGQNIQTAHHHAKNKNRKITPWSKMLFLRALRCFYLVLTLGPYNTFSNPSNKLVRIKNLIKSNEQFFKKGCRDKEGIIEGTTFD